MSTQHRTHRSLLVHCLAGTTASFLAISNLASAQYTVGNPRPLDRNPTVGLQGRNPGTAADVGALNRYNNAVVTGNAGNGRSFKGYVGYLAPDDFRASLGTNDLFAFRRDSTSGAQVNQQVNQGIRGTDALRYQFLLSTGQAPPSLLSGPSATPSGAPIYTRNTSLNTSSTGAALRSTSDYLGTRALQPSVVGYRTGEDGQGYALTASPLLGVTMVPMDLPGSASSKAKDTSLVPLGQVPPGGTVPTVPDGKIPRPGEAEKKKDFPDKRESDTRGLSGLEATRPGLLTPLAAQQMVDTANAALRVNNRVSAPEAVMDPFKKGLPAEKTAVPPADEKTALDKGQPPKAPWERELDALRERLKKEETEKKKNSDQVPAPKETPSNGIDPPINPGLPGLPTSGGENPKNKPKSSTPRTDPMTLDEIRELTRPDLEELDKDVLRALISTRPVLDHLVPAKPTDNLAYDYHMLAGETFLNNGRFFDAEDRFLRALAASPKDPLASIGRAHSQLGAGLFLSAASNLHTLLADHPEMIGTRYDRALLFSVERSDDIAKQMRADIKNKDTLLGRDAAMLLAYIGYQRGDRAMLEEGVKAFAGLVRADVDADRADLTLLSLMQRVWVDGADEADKSPAPPTTPQPVKPEPAAPAVPPPAPKDK